MPNVQYVVRYVWLQWSVLLWLVWGSIHHKRNSPRSRRKRMNRKAAYTWNMRMKNIYAHQLFHTQSQIFCWNLSWHNFVTPSHALCTCTYTNHFNTLDMAKAVLVIPNPMARKFWSPTPCFVTIAFRLVAGSSALMASLATCFCFLQPSWLKISCSSIWLSSCLLKLKTFVFQCTQHISNA